MSNYTPPPKVTKDVAAVVNFPSLIVMKESQGYKEVSTFLLLSLTEESHP